MPGVSLSLLGQVDAGEIDIAVMIRPPYALPAELEWRALLSEPFELLAPAPLGAFAAAFTACSPMAVARLPEALLARPW